MEAEEASWSQHFFAESNEVTPCGVFACVVKSSRSFDMDDFLGLTFIYPRLSGIVVTLQDDPCRTCELDGEHPQIRNLGGPFEQSILVSKTLNYSVYFCH